MNVNPLSGCRILITRSISQSQNIQQRLTQLGAIPIVFPVIEIKELSDYARVDQTLLKLSQYHWIVITSVNGANQLVKRLKKLNLLNTCLPKIAVIGHKTAEVLLNFNFTIDFIPSKSNGKTLATEILLSGIKEGTKILALRAEIANQDLVKILTDNQMIVDDIPIYRTIQPLVPEKHPVYEMLKKKTIDYIIFFSPSAVRNFYMLMQQNDLIDVLKPVKLVSIGPTTSGQLFKLFNQGSLQALNAGVNGIVNAILTDFQKSNL